jgi:multidrug resistance efflux pump
MTSLSTPSRLRRRRRRNWLQFVLLRLPAVVWLGAIVAAIYLYQRVGTTGTITGFADDQPVSLAHFEAGVVRDVEVNLHDWVRRGQMVVELENTEERIALSVIESDLLCRRAQVEAERAQLELDAERTLIAAEDLGRRFLIDREAAQIDYLTQWAVNARDAVLLRGAKVEDGWLQPLKATGSAAFLELNTSQTNVDSLQALVERNKKVLAEKKTAFRDADQRWSNFVHDRSSDRDSEPILTPIRLAVDTRQRELEGLVERIDRHVLRAPIDGQVTQLAVHTGDSITAGTTLLSISPRTTRSVVGYLPEAMAVSVQPGARVSVECLAQTREGRRAYRGKVHSLSDTVTEAPVRYRQIPAYPVWGRCFVLMMDDDAALIPGEAVRIELVSKP